MAAWQAVLAQHHVANMAMFHGLGVELTGHNMQAAECHLAWQAWPWHSHRKKSAIGVHTSCASASSWSWRATKNLFLAGATHPKRSFAQQPTGVPAGHLGPTSIGSRSKHEEELAARRDCYPPRATWTYI